MKTIAEFCKNCQLLERGRTLKSGPTPEVISTYLNRSRICGQSESASKPVSISRVAIRDETGECLHFKSGSKAWVDIELTARKPCTKLSVSLYFTNEQFQEIFSISTERLGHGNFSLKEGQTYKCTFALDLNLANGIFYASVLVFRYDTETEYDRWHPALTINVSYDDDVRGAANCFPKLTRQEIRTTPETDRLASVTGTRPL